MHPGDQRSAQAIPGASMSVSQRIAALGVIFARNTTICRNIGNIFFGPAFLVTVEEGGGRPYARRLGGAR